MAGHAKAISEPDTTTMCEDPRSRAGDPRDEYTERLALHEAMRDRYERRHRKLGFVKLLVALITLAVAFLAVGSRSVSTFWVLLPAFGFALLSNNHERVIRAMRTTSRTIAFYERRIHRLNNQWIGTGQTGERFLDPSHLYARDLDLFGTGSLFELLCTARTSMGEETLAKWLLEPAALEEIHSRQTALRELRGRLDLREELAVLGEDVRTGVRPTSLSTWGQEKPLLKYDSKRAAIAFLSLSWIFSLIALAGWRIAYPVLLISVLNSTVAYRARRQIQEVIAPVENAAHELGVLSNVLARLEREKFSAPKLIQLRHKLDTGGKPPSRCIAQLNRLVSILDSRRHQIVRIIDPFVLWSLQSAIAVEVWRSKFGPSIPGWTAAVGEMEALSDLAAYCYERPNDVFPEFTERGPHLQADELAHPLIPEGKAVRNSLTLADRMRLAILSGPNMSGKSTFVRAIGINLVLAQCGAPVRASRLRMSQLRVTASICVLDSLQGGISRFYAEITRLKRIIDLASESIPVLFLLDEFLQGTNSHDRRIAAEAILRKLISKGAIGLVTTHDLALTQIPELIGPLALNFHFADSIKDGKLQFDYRLRPGIVQTSNALEVMRSIGLEV